MNGKTFLNFWHRLLGRSRLITKVAVLLRNQSRCIIKYHLNETANPLKNGESWLIQQIAPSLSNFIDVGANVGNYANLLLRETPSSAEIKAILIEPSLLATKILQERFNRSGNVHVIQAAVSNFNGESTFFEELEAGETSSLISGVSNCNAAKKIVNVVSLDVVVQEYKLENIDFLKIDTEGNDLHVLQGAIDLLSQNKISIIQFEYGGAWAKAGSTLKKAYELLESFGYRIFILKSSGLFELDYSLYEEYFTYSNHVAVSPHTFSQLKQFIRGSI
jgi:FkbM family methyltransferase